MAVKGENIRNYGRATEEPNSGHLESEAKMPNNSEIKQTGKTRILTLKSPGVTTPHN